jgi:hypothetical protein
MGIGASIVLLALGAILTFAVEADVAGLDIATVGIILMVAGGIGLLMSLIVWGPRRRTVADSHSVPQDPV